MDMSLNRPISKILPERILDEFNEILLTRNKPLLNLNQVVFIHGAKLLSYGKVVCLVSRWDLVELDQFEKAFSSFLDQKPVVIQAHLIPMEHKRFLIELMFGPPAENEVPEIVGKPDFRRIVKIV